MINDKVVFDGKMYKTECGPVKNYGNPIPSSKAWVDRWIRSRFSRRQERLRFLLRIERSVWPLDSLPLTCWFVYTQTGVESFEGASMSDSLLTRSQFVRLTAVLGLGSVGAGGCAGGGTLRDSRSSSAAISRGDKAAGQRIVAENELDPDSSFTYLNAATGQPEILVPLRDGELVAYSAVCTHQGCQVVYLRQRRKLGCPCHGGLYDPANGAEVVSGPPPRPLPPVGIEIRDGIVYRT